MPIPKPNKNESEKDFIQRCMSDSVMVNEYDTDQRFAVCQDAFKTKLAGEKISFDFDGTLTTKRGYEKAKQLINVLRVYVRRAYHELNYSPQAVRPLA